MLDCELAVGYSRVAALTLECLHLGQYDEAEKSKYIVVKLPGPCHPFRPGRDRLTTCDADAWSRASKVTITILFQRPNPFSFTSYADDSSTVYKLRIVRTDADNMPLDIVDLCPRNSGRAIGQPRSWLGEIALRRGEPIFWDRDRGREYGVRIRVGGHRIHAVIAIDQSTRVLRMSLPMLHGRITILTPEDRVPLKNSCERYTETDTTMEQLASSTVGDLLLDASITGRLPQLGDDVALTLEMSVRRHENTGLQLTQPNV
jgi:hypothetical protein